ncbi:hypothetical protein [Nocardioides sp.]|uniref:hypothetical protein n=1 Tax=Nocardioides sp. TaxID=35761 RepID=UPI00261B8AE9|nr:hypothetical protein [Nocardioides sp.]MCW2737526.1 hypothetical protein [Nocardioides sp.]
MSQLGTAPHRSAHPPLTRTVARWMVSFLGFPLGGLAAMVVSGPVDSPAAAILGGLLTGSVLGAAQAVAMRADLLTWVTATAAGLAVGLAVGSSVVDHRTGLGDLVVQGAISGLGVGAAQSLVLVRRIGPVALLWPAYLAAAWAIGWAVTTAAGVQVEEQFTVFGAAGAVTVTLLTAVLPVLLHTRSFTEKSS